MCGKLRKSGYGRLVIAAGWTGLLCGTLPAALAQAEKRNDPDLPAVEVRAPAATHAGAERRQRSRVSTASALSARRGTAAALASPQNPGAAGRGEEEGGSGTRSVIDAAGLARTGSLNFADVLAGHAGGVNLSEVTGNPFAPNIEFRGFVASPLAGTPQGLAVYQNGLRVNEAFTEAVNWDLIATVAIRSAALETSNPFFGLNALGGAIDLRMKDGFTWQGGEINLMGGSFGRAQGSVQWGRKIGDNWAVYGAFEGAHDDGFRNFSSSDLRRFYGDIGYRFEGTEFHLNMGAAGNRLAGPSTVPAELADRNWGASYTTPQGHDNNSGLINLTGKVEATPNWTFSGTLHMRGFAQNTVDGNPTDVLACGRGGSRLCFADDDVPASGLNGEPLKNPFAPGAVLGEIDRTSTRSLTFGLSGQATYSDTVFSHDNRLVLGASLDRAVTRFDASSELGSVGTDYVVRGSGVFLGQSGDPVAIGPVSLRAANTDQAISVLDSFSVTRAWTITAGGRYNAARVAMEDRIGTALNGDHRYDRFNPVLATTFQVTPDVTAYAGYSEANRVPTPLELGCADPANPCLIAAFLVADPDLRQVVSKTVEGGLRGESRLQIGTVSWKIGGFRTTNQDDILTVPIPGLQGYGYFRNVGTTRRQGGEAEIRLKAAAWQLFASYAFVDARFRGSLDVGSNSPFADDDGNIAIQPGNQIPNVPRHRIKAGIDFCVTDAWKVGADALFVSSQYYVGDESNQASKLPSYAVLNLHTSYDISKSLQVYARIDNVADNRYASYGTFFDRTALPNFANGGAAFTDARSLSPARPRAFYAGMKVTF
ncbi:MAG: TonB-dependent receptor [Alphaproteobacteria bacterium]|nr:TonB-dependent receptor [Alphaproteobacteria bacterium]